MATKKHATRRKKNPASQEEVDRFVRAQDELVLYAMPVSGRYATAKDWETGKKFHTVNAIAWTGSPFFDINDAQRIYDMGYRKIVVMGGAGGFDVDLVMQ